MTTITISPTRTKNTKFIAIPQFSSKSGKQWCNKWSTELHCRFITADSIADTKRVVPNLESDSGWICIPKSGQVWLSPDLKYNSQIRNNPSVNV